MFILFIMKSHHIFPRLVTRYVGRDRHSKYCTNKIQPWPIVERFLKERAKGSIGIDVGCGNGKYLGVNKDVFMIGSDRSDGLIGCAKEFGHEVLVSDGLALPHPDNTFDFAISIAVIHHFSTPERRTEAIKHILSKLHSGAEALIYVWALEQENSRRGYKEGDPQDVLVPWVLQKKGKKKEDPQEEPDTKFRYYHLYQKGELEENALAAGGQIVEQGYERDNWYVIIRKP